MGLIYKLGRAVVGGFFLYNGINHFRQTEALKGYTAAKQVPHPELAVKLSGATLVASGLSLLFGIKPQIGALAGAAFLAAVSPTIHDFWNQEESQRQNEMIHFSKNVALMGAVLALAAASEECEPAD
jgi:uncharacterized membrane protein YphA (DoxX/SURF4 family)